MNEKIIELEVKNKKYQFKQVKLYFGEHIKENVFSQLNNKTLSDTLNKDKYLSFREKTKDIYSKYLDVKIGEFLLMLKEKNDMYYKNFLNKYGDKQYIDFYIKDETVFKEQGVYLFCINDEIKYVGRCTEGKNNYNFKKRINNGYGKITPINCYIEGRSTNCRINSIINKNKDNVEFYTCSLENDKEIKIVEYTLSLDENGKKRDWNISTPPKE